MMKDSPISDCNSGHYIQENWKHYLAVLFLIFLTYYIWTLSKEQSDQKRQQEFNSNSEQLVNKIINGMSQYENVLHSGVALYKSHDFSMDSNKWKKFSESLDLKRSHPGVNGIGVVSFIPRTSLKDVLEKYKVQRPNFEVHPSLHNSNSWPIVYIEPESENKEAIGLDLSFESNRLIAAKKSRDSNTPKITAPIILVQDKKNTPGFLFYFPFYSKSNLKTVKQYRDNFVGHIYAPFVMNKLIKGILGGGDREIKFSIKDEGQVLYSEIDDVSSGVLLDSRFNITIKVEMYGRPWDFNINISDDFEDDEVNTQELFISIASVVIDLIIIILFSSLSRSNKRSLLESIKIGKKLKVSESYFRHIIEAAPCGIIIITEEGCVEEINPHAKKLFDYGETSLLGESIDLLVPERYRDSNINSRKSFMSDPLRENMTLGRKMLGKRSDGGEFPVEIGLAHFSVEKSSKILVTVVDMTKNVQVTNELTRSNQELSDFAYVASHDLKAPLRGIIQLAGWIEEDIVDFANDDTQLNLGLLKNRAVRLETLLGDLLAYSRIGRDLGGVNKIDVEKSVNEVFNLFNPPKDFKLEFEGSSLVLKTKIVPLETIFRNLIGNSIKHHDRVHGVISVSVVEKENVYVFSFCDDGPGIKKNHHQQVFELFKTLKPRDEIEGSGMGLAIIKKLLAYYYQDIKLISGDHRGTCFIFSWPKNVN